MFLNSTFTWLEMDFLILAGFGFRNENEMQIYSDLDCLYENEGNK